MKSTRGPDDGQDLDESSAHTGFDRESVAAGPMSGAASRSSREITGLAESEARARRSRGLGNVSLPSSGRTYAEILRENVFTFINSVLFGLGLALILLGRWSDALVSVGVVTVNLLVGTVQEVRAKRVLDRIALLTRPTATVIREGRERSVDLSEVVLGDALLVRPGDQIVADGVVLDAGRMEVDESLLTGESDLVTKGGGDPLFAGSFCVSGSASYEAQKVGASSLAGQVTAQARAFRRVYTPLQREINLVVRIILLVAVSFEILLIVDAFVEGLPLVESVKIAVVIAGLVPNGLFLAIAAAYAMGAVRIAGQRVLVQQANAVESLSHVDVLCMDKTGTLTTGEVTFHDLDPVAAEPADLRRLLGDYAASASGGNRTTVAIAKACAGTRRALRDEVPFSSSRKWSALAFADSTLPGTYVLGAPEILLRYVDPARAASVEALAGKLATSGLRLVLFAHHASPRPLRDSEGQPRLPSDLNPLGLVSLLDTLRPEAKETLAGFAAAGIKLKILSGDDPRTTLAVALQAGFPPGTGAASGLDLAEADPSRLGQIVAETAVLGRLTPQQKEQLVQALKSQGHYVAFIGDGVNDVLALKRANLAIAVRSGSQAARAVADMILLDDAFASLPAAFREGQRIFHGMQGILRLFLTRVLYVALLIAAIGVVDAGFPLAPKHNALLTLLTVGIPTIALAAWARPEHPPSGTLVRSLLHFVLPAAWTLTLVGVAVYVGYFLPNRDALLRAVPGPAPATALQAAQAIAQSALTTVSVFCGLLLVVLSEPPISSWTDGTTRAGDWRPAGLAIVLLLAFVAILAVAPLRVFFELVPLGIADYVMLGLVSLGWAFALRWIWHARILELLLGLDPDEPSGPLDEL